MPGSLLGNAMPSIVHATNVKFSRSHGEPFKVKSKHVSLIRKSGLPRSLCLRYDLGIVWGYVTHS